ncbi:ArnT family glycosyltransferase [Parabacteroides pacaensis]|uniref:ArnT family glycosyltransferase n=1 Tax=Parabacteroides pacaensis TaxID=2086575 RepID=UPI000D10F7FC|nr:glycosyltransferase family 39 protein [Parabacteroides pacaensis]
MRTPTLQYLYLQKPVTMIIFVCIISVLPWIGVGDFATKGEPREAAVAVSMLETGNWILPQVYADEIAYKPPFAHWLMAVASYPEGHVTEFTSRLPSAIAFTVMIGFILVFFGKRFKFQEAFIATLLLITCFEIHRAAMTTRVDMVLTSLIVIGLIQLYRWEEKLELKGLPIAIPILLGCAVLTKGPVGVILPLFVFGVYLLMLRKYKFLVIFKSLLYVFISSLFLPALWYAAAWRQGGDEFFNLVWAENFGRFFRLSTPEISYELGHERGFFYNFVTILAGFIPWTLFFVFSLFGMKIMVPHKSVKEIAKNVWRGILNMEKPQLFGLVTIVCILFFYSIPSSKRSVYLMPAYPFIALFLAKYAIYITEYRMKVTRVFASFMSAIAIVVLLVILLTTAGLIHPVHIVENYTQNTALLAQVDILANSWTHLSSLSGFVLFIVFVALATVYYQMRKKINIKILYATIGLVFSLNLLIDGVIMKSLREGTSCKGFAEQIKREYSLNKGNVYVVNNLRVYPNFYGLNFYLGNIFQNFDVTTPEEGYFITTDKFITRIENEYSEYRFTPVASTNTALNETDQKIVLLKFVRK